MRRWLSAGLPFLLTALAAAPRGAQADQDVDGGLAPAEILSPPVLKTRVRGGLSARGPGRSARG